MKTMAIWVPTDQAKWGKPRCIALDAEPPQAGKVYKVEAQSAEDGVAKVELSIRPQPDESTDRHGWFLWRTVSHDVTLVGDYAGTRAKPEPKPVLAEEDSGE